MVTIHQLDLMILEFFSNLNDSKILKIRKRAVRCDRSQLSKQNGEKLLRHQWGQGKCSPEMRMASGEGERFAGQRLKKLGHCFTQ